MQIKIKDEKLYYVGGVVRDEIIGTAPFDVDLCYEGNAIEFAQKFEILRSNPEFGTVRIDLDGKEVDIASTREEDYPQKGHLPVVTRIGCELKKDLARRDFTINALAKNTVTGELVDYFEGINDIKNKKLRVLHSGSFIDDPSRIIRGLKFSERFGFTLEESTRVLQDEYLNKINYNQSYHRLKKELKETFSLNKDSLLERFINQDIYKLLGEKQEKPEIKTSICELVNKYNPDIIWIVYVGMFDLTNFALTVSEQGIIDAFGKIKSIRPQNDVEIYKLFSNIPLETILLYAASIDNVIAERYLDYLKKIKILINGNDLKDLGIRQGVVYSKIFDYVLENKIVNPNISKYEELNLAREYSEQYLDV